MRPLVFSSVVPACGFCLQVQSRSREVKESRSGEVETDRRPLFSRDVEESKSRGVGKPTVDPILRVAAWGGVGPFLDFPTCQFTEPGTWRASREARLRKKHKKNTNEASM